ncbi:MAG: hypothetical protein AABN33_01560 [Acidobacteriota bacterium]
MSFKESSYAAGLISPFIFIASGRPFNITTGRDNNNDTLFTDRPAFTNPDDPEAIITRFGMFNPNPRSSDQIIPRNFGEGPGQISVNVNVSKTFGFNVPTTAWSGQAASGSGQQANRGQGNRGVSGGSASRDHASADARPIYLRLSINAENLFNHTNFAGPKAVLTSPFFGRANRALPARRIELALRFSF